MTKHHFLISTFLVLFFGMQAFAQAPLLFNYQGIARDAAGNPLANQVMGIKLSILPAADANLAEYEEIQTVRTNEFGLYSLQIGNGKALSGNIKNIQWETGNKYIKVGIDPTGGNHYVDAGTSQLLSVPYAIYADKAGVAINDKTRTGAVNSEAAHVAADANYLTKFTGLNTIGKSAFYQSPATGNIGLGTNNPTANAKMHIFQPNLAGNTEYLRMQNLDSFAFGKFILYNDIPTNYSTFTKYGSKFPGGYAGIASQYPFANMLAFGNNLGPFLLANNGDVGIGIVTAGSTKLYFNARQSTGYLGIGGSALPSANVHINSSSTGDTLRITNATTGHLNTDGLEIKNSGNAASIINKENSSLDFGTSNTTRMSITPNGNVGIGILNPVEDALHIKRAYSSIRLEDSNDNVSLYLVAPDPSTFTTGGIGTSSFHELPFWTNNIERMVIKADGKIGIGTNTPSTALDVNGQIKIQGGSPGVGKVLTSDATGLASWLTVNAWGLNGNAGTIPGINFVGTTDNQPLEFKVNSVRSGFINHLNAETYFGFQAGSGGAGSSAFGYRALASTSGSQNAAFGAYALDSTQSNGENNTGVGFKALFGNLAGDFNTAVGYNSGIGNKTGFNNTIIGANTFNLNDTGSYNTIIGSEAMSGTRGSGNTLIGALSGGNSQKGDYNVYIGYGAGWCANGSNKLYIENKNNCVNTPLIYGNFATGQVAFGSTTPSAKFTVVDGTTGTYTPTGWLHSSDARLKTNINPLSNSLQKILQLNGVSYYWKFSPDSNRQIGFIAQDVEKIFPEVVVVDKEGKYGMAYQNLVAPMVEAMKEQQSEIEKLKIQNQELLKRLEALENK